LIIIVLHGVRRYRPEHAIFSPVWGLRNLFSIPRKPLTRFAARGSPPRLRTGRPSSKKGLRAGKPSERGRHYRRFPQRRAGQGAGKRPMGMPDRILSTGAA